MTTKFFVINSDKRNINIKSTLQRNIIDGFLSPETKHYWSEMGENVLLWSVGASRGWGVLLSCLMISPGFYVAKMPNS